VQVKLLNNTPKGLTPNLLLSALKSAEPPRTVEARIVSFERTPELPAGGEISVAFKIASTEKIAGGQYSGQLTAYTTNPDTVVRVPVTLVAGTKGTVSPKPLVAKQTMQAVRWIPFVDETVAVRDPWIPLSSDVKADLKASDLALADGTILGGVAGDDRGVASIEFVGEVKELPDHVAGIKINAFGLNGPGKYVGKIDLLPDDATAGEVDFTVVAKDSILWVLICLVAGIALALWFRHWRGVARPVIRMGQAEAGLRRRYRSALRSFKSKAKRQPWRGYTTTGDFHSVAKELRASLDRIAKHGFDQMDADEAKQARAKLASLDEHVKAWAGFDKELADLKRSLDEVDELGSPAGLLPAGASEEPAFSREGRTLLHGAKLTIEEFSEVKKRVASATKLAKEWPKLHDTVAIYAKRLKELEEHEDELDRDEIEAFHQARTQFVGAWTLMWEAESPEDAQDPDLEDRLLTAESQIAGLMSSLREPGKPAREWLAGAVFIDVPSDLQLESILPPITAGGALEEAPSDPARREEFFKAAIRTGDRWQVSFAAVVALFTGLTALYWGKTWGTPVDYLTAFLWGLTTTAAIDLLAEAIRTYAEPETAIPPPSVTEKPAAAASGTAT
jgi:hypothetical protein